MLAQVLFAIADYLLVKSFHWLVEGLKVKSPDTSRGRDNRGSKSPDFASMTFDSTHYPVPSTQYPAPSTQYPVPSTQYQMSQGRNPVT
jgi:hypothetical protein